MRCTGGIISDIYSIYLAEDKMISVTSGTMIDILDFLEVDRTASEISKKLDIPLSTVNNQIRMLLDFEMIKPVENTYDSRKQYYHKNCVRFISRNGEKIKRRAELQQMTRTILQHFDSQKESKPLPLFLNAWNIYYGANVGIEFDKWMELLGKNLFNLWINDIKSDTIEKTVEKAKNVLINAKVIDSLDVKSFMPMSFDIKYTKEFPEYPDVSGDMIIVGFMTALISDYAGKLVVPSYYLSKVDDMQRKVELRYVV